MNQEVWLPEYLRLRAMNHPADKALRAAKVNAEFHRLEGQLVKLDVVADPDPHDVSYVDTWGLSLRSTEREKKLILDRVRSEGHWCLCAYARSHESEDWELVDSVGDFVGNEYVDSAYAVELRATALAALAIKGGAYEVSWNGTHAREAPLHVMASSFGGAEGIANTFYPHRNIHRIIKF